MPHPLLVQLRIMRSEPDASRRAPPMNCMSRNAGHLAWQKQVNVLTRLHGKTPPPHLNDLAGYKRPPSTPPLAEMVDTRQQIIELVDPFLDTLTAQQVATVVATDDRGVQYTPGVTRRVRSSTGSSTTTGTTWARARRFGRCSTTPICRSSSARSSARRPISPH